MKELITAGKNESGIAVYEFMDATDREQAAQRAGWFEKNCGKHFYAAVFVDRWNDDLSPWRSEAAGRGGGFAGNGAITLKRFSQEMLPKTEAEKKPVCRIAAGYSLAGLFSLWSFYETEMFQGAVSCSGSLWYPGWEEYSQQAAQRKKAEGIIYLSLGVKEEKTRNPLMARVGEASRREWESIQSCSSPEKSILEWNPGGHFTDPDKRMQRGIQWAVEAMEKKKNR